MKIGILGIGAVGGYFGGLLADRYYGSDEVKVIFITRPSTGEVIRKHGLTLITPQEEKTIHPFLASHDAHEIGVLDLLICATKSYDLEEGLAAISGCIGNHTLILPLLNGVDAKDRISRLYPQAEVLHGCVYIVARRIAPGVIRETGSVHKLYFGSSSVAVDRLGGLQKIFKDAGIDSYLSEHIESDIWEKFLFTASMASTTSYFDQPIGEVMSDPGHRQTAIALIRETKFIADARKILLPDHIVERTVEKMEKLPFDATSSMHSDFQKGGKTEYRSLTQYVAIQGDELGIDTPVFDGILTGFTERERQLERGSS